MDGTFSTKWTRLIYAGVWWKTSKEKDYLEKLGVDEVSKLK
jgi:hypothetical protein